MKKINDLSLHSEWRIILLVCALCAGAAISVDMWRFHHQSDVRFWISLLVFVLASFVAVFLRGRDNMLGKVLIAGLIGILLGQLRIELVRQDVPVAEGYAQITGVLERLDYRHNKPVRLYIRPLSIGKNKGNLPDLIRVTARTHIDEGVRSGDVLSFNARLSLPNGPIVPGGYDFARTAFFDGIGADAVALSTISLIDANSDREGFNAWVLSAREALERKILAVIPGQAGAVAVALTVGFRNHLTEDTTDELRRAGLSHLLAISGLHMGLVTTIGFFFFEAIFAAIPAVGLRYMPKKLAVVPTWFVAFSYLFLSGASVSTVRAFIMVSVALLAVLAERRVFSLRSIALAALIIVILRPESVLSVGFQMSFAATTGLVAVYEGLRHWHFKIWQSYWGKALSYVGGVALTSVIAQISIAPFALYHFQALSVGGVISNVIVLPVVGFFVMPMLFGAVMLSAIGGIGLFAGPLSFFLGFVLNVTSWAAALPFAMFWIPPISEAGLILACLFLLTALVIRERAIVVISLTGVLLSFTALGQRKVADILISETGSIVAEKHEGQIFSAGGRKYSFRNKAWRTYWGQDPQKENASLPRFCDISACSYEIASGSLLIKANTIGGVRKACAAGHIVILPRRYQKWCKGSVLNISLEKLEKYGPLGLKLAQDGTIETLWSQSIRQ